MGVRPNSASAMCTLTSYNSLETLAGASLLGHTQMHARICVHVHVYTRVMNNHIHNALKDMKQKRKVKKQRKMLRYTHQ